VGKAVRLSETIVSTDRPAGRECPKCAEAVADEDTACSFCGFPIRPRKPLLVRLAEIVSLAAALAVIIVICRGIGQLLGV
jgi:hypothetical protein